MNNLISKSLFSLSVEHLHHHCSIGIIHVSRLLKKIFLNIFIFKNVQLQRIDRNYYEKCFVDINVDMRYNKRKEERRKHGIL